ncbi:hypothetical protein Hypma_006390 [Hypsizygus marmoreus]|uniref:Uncharacterized protein n=1 Tax=Hypsizygus marmoreus TaxID=39966 RepID=A0A369JXR4_HYPMA|nr:hypothetical protein Hypma_006390 [Hypsizygus marmoreus]
MIARDWSRMNITLSVSLPDKHRHRSYEKIEQNTGKNEMRVSLLQASANTDVDEDMVQKAFQVARYLDQCSKSGYGQAKLIHDLTKQKDEARETWMRLATELEETTKQRDDAQENLVQLAGDLQSMTWQRDEDVLGWDARSRVWSGKETKTLLLAHLRCRQLYADLRAVAKEKREIERSEEILATELRNLAKQTSRAAKEKVTRRAEDLKDMTMQRDQALKEKAEIVTMYNAIVQEICMRATNG